MKNLKQRVLTGAMAGVLAVSLAVPAFAAKNTTKVTGTYKEIPISVVVPTAGTATINPYGLPVSVEKSTGASVNISGQKITTMPLSIKNQGDVKLDVGATVTGVIKTGSTMTFSTESTAAADDGSGGATTKTAFVFLDTKSTTMTGADDDALADKIIDEFSKWSKTEYDADKHLVVGTTAVSSDDETPIATLNAATVTNGEFSAYKGGSIALFRLTGDCVAAPKKDDAADPWTSKDGFDVTIAFTFAPSAS